MNQSCHLGNSYALSKEHAFSHSVRSRILRISPNFQIDSGSSISDSLFGICECRAAHCAGPNELDACLH